MSAPNWTIQKRQIADLIPYDKNPRHISDEQFQKLKNSIREDGYHARAVVDMHNVIIAGHMRLRALADLGFTEAEVLVPNRELTPEEFDRINLRDNIEFGEFDVELLQDRFTPEYLEDLGLVLELEEKVVENDPSGDADDIPEPPVEARTNPGDVYEIGLHRLICGDSTLPEVIKGLMGDRLADLLLTDPPYNVAYEGKTEQALTIQNDKMSDANFREFLKKSFMAADECLKQGGVFYIWHADSEGYNFRGACQDAGWKVRQCLIWLKNSMVLGRQDYQWRHEPCLYGWKDGAGHFWNSDRKQTTILEFDRPSRNGEHPTMKPVDLISYLITNSTRDGEVVLDAFGGSGSTMVAAHMHNRVAMLAELDPKYCDVIVTRMHKLYPELEIKRNGETTSWE